MDPTATTTASPAEGRARRATAAMDRDLNADDLSEVLQTAAGFCTAVSMILLGPILGILAGVKCRGFAAKYNFIATLDDAAKHKSCLRLTYPKAFAGRLFFKAGVTDNPRFCKGRP